MLSGEYCYRNYVKIKLHFSHIFRYNINEKRGGIRLTRKNYLDRDDIHFFMRLSRRFQNKSNYQEFLIANFLENENTYISFLITEEAFNIYTSWKKIEEGKKYYFKEQSKLIKIEADKKKLSFNEMIAINNNGYSLLLRCLLGHKIDFQIFIIFEKIFNFSKQYNILLKDDIIWKVINNRILAYKIFVNDDLRCYKKIILDIWRNDDN